MNETTILQYRKAYQRAIDFMTGFYADNKEETNIRKLIVNEYKRHKMDPDGKAIRIVGEIKCTADALLSILRICSMEKNKNDIIPVYKEYRKEPIFFFPCENGGINTSRNSALGDRIDYTLFDLKMYFISREKCLLKNAYNRLKTKNWLEHMGSFENIVDWFGIKGIFTDEDYNVFDLDYEDEKVITFHKNKLEYQKEWTSIYYSNIKKKKQDFYKRVLNEE